MLYQSTDTVLPSHEAARPPAAPRPAKSSPRRWGHALRTCGSLKLGVGLMIAIGLAMATATVYEARHGAEFAQILFYRSWWFSALLAALAVNIFAATLARWPFRLRKIGFPITHLGILVILGGAVVTNLFGLDARLRLVEQTESDRVAIAQAVVAVDARDASASSGRPDAAATDEFALPMNPLRPSRGLDRARTGPSTGLSLTFESYLPSSQWEQHFEPAATGDPAVQMSVAVGDSTKALRYWLSPRSGPLSLGRVSVELLAVRDDQAAEAAAATLLNAGPTGVLRVSVGGTLKMVDVAEASRQPVPLGSSGLTVRVTATYPDAVVGEDGRLGTRSDEPNNPAVQYKIHGEKGVDRRVAFARFPTFDRIHARSRLFPGVEATYVVRSARAETTQLLLIARGETLKYVVTDADSQRVQGVAAPGERIAPDRLGLGMAVEQYLPHSREVNAPVPLDDDPSAAPASGSARGSPAVRVRVEAGGAHESVWLGWAQPVQVWLGGRRYVLTLRDREHRLPFRVRLDRFERETYPGTQQAAMFASTVTLTDPATGTTMSRTIRMNEPLYYGGYTFFQSGFEPIGARSASILSVSRDPGKWAVYVGFALVCGGVVTMVVTKRIARAVPASRPLRGGGPAEAEAALDPDADEPTTRLEPAPRLRKEQLSWSV